MTYILNENQVIEPDFSTLTDAEEKKMLNEEVPESISILPLKNTVLFPGVVIPITVGRDKSIQLIKDATATPDKLIGVIAQRNLKIEDPEPQDLFETGTIAHIMRTIRMPDGSITIVIQGRSRFRVKEFIQDTPYFKATVEKLQDIYPDSNESKALMMSLRQDAHRAIDLSPQIPSEAKVALNNISSLSFLIHFIASNLNVEVKEKQHILEISNLKDKGQEVLEFLGKELAVLELSEEINSKVRSDLDKQQREYYLRQQIKAIHDELGEGGVDSDMEEYRKRAEKKKWSTQAQEVFTKELAKLSRLSPNMPEYAVVSNYLDWLLDLPWQKFSKDKFDFKFAREVLDKDHYGLEKVKDRILEYLAVLKLKNDKKAPIICFYGPPGVGKTSLGRSIAKALGREFLRVSLGGVHDEAEIRGHRRTYIGAMPGRIIQGLKKAKFGNPVFMLDEIDKVGNDFRGDPSSALLEVLDPAQNNTFQDHFLEVDYDLSRVMFIATANSLDTIHPALRDRMEIIEINGYSQEEKIEIAKRHLVPDAVKDHGLGELKFKLADDSISAMISGYTRESGVRKLAQKIAAVCRIAARQFVMDEKKSVKVTAANLEEYLGVAYFEKEAYQKATVPGVSIGLAWTPVGGDILFIETTLHRGNGRLSMTGKLGEVMKESAELAWHFLKANANQLGIPHKVFSHWDIHVHFPAGAIPKDGPSAGIAILTAMTSAFTQKLVKSNIAMTGEITLRGKVLPVGGIKEKLLAAIRAGIKTVYLCRENRKDVSEIKQDYLKGLKIVYVEEMMEVLSGVLERRQVSSALDLQAAIAENGNGQASKTEAKKKK